MDDGIFEATGVVMWGCTEDCPCSHVHIALTDSNQEPVARLNMDPALARNVAKDLNELADEMDAEALRKVGRLT